MAFRSQRRTITIPEPDFRTSEDLRRHMDSYRQMCRTLAMMAHMDAAELEASLSTIRPRDGVFRKTRARFRARRVSRHLRHVADCFGEAGAGSVRTFGAYRAEYAPELAPNVRPNRKAFTP